MKRIPMPNVENKVLFVLNPISGGLDKEQFKTQLHHICIEQSLAYRVIETTGEADQQRIEKEIKAFKPTCVVACGGDGTINLVGQTVMGKPVTLGVIPLGSANGLATELLISNNLEENLNVILEGDTLKLDVLEVNGTHFCLHLADVGFNAKLVQEYDAATGRGKLTYAWSFMKTIVKKEGIRCRIRLNGQEFKQKMEMITFANARKYGTGALINPLGKLDDGRYELCIFEPYPRWKLPHLTFLFFSGRLQHSKHVEIISTEQAEVFLLEPQPLQIDGEVIGMMKEVKVRVHPKKILLKVPKTYEAA